MGSCLTASQFAVSCLLLKLNRPGLSRSPHSGMFTLLMAFVVVIVTWVGNIVLAYVAVLCLPFLPRLYFMCAQPHLPRCLCCFFHSSFHRIVRHECSANYSEARPTILLGWPAIAIGADAGMATPVGVVVQGASGGPCLRMDKERRRASLL